ncbi:MAG: metallophosphoesterase [Candidatus Poseidoniaceae archaeon]|jgi:serine/threonine protein phosphatase 1|tara:strand:- start:708 stop:1550 length:843 start_codon:yes stop_codon:yes gene_type:complete
MMRALRDSAIEKELQSTLDRGHKVWVIGDVHGFSVTLRQMIETLNLSSEDRVVLLGDLIDRGPDSFDVIRCAREDHRIFCVKGNHEGMMAANFTMEKIDHPDQDAIAWYHNGGRETVASYFRAFPEDAQGGALQWMMKEDIDWVTELPAHIVLDRWRLVHAGYNPDCGTEEQTEKDLLWIRSAFYRNTHPIDSERTVVFGHTPTMTLYPRSEDRWGEVWFADVELEDGRSASIGMDTCVFHISDHPAVLTALDLQTLEIRSLNRCEPWEEDDRIRARFMH